MNSSSVSPGLRSSAPLGLMYAVEDLGGSGRGNRCDNAGLDSLVISQSPATTKIGCSLTNRKTGYISL